MMEKQWTWTEEVPLELKVQSLSFFPYSEMIPKAVHEINTPKIIFPSVTAPWIRTVENHFCKRIPLQSHQSHHPPLIRWLMGPRELCTMDGQYLAAIILRRDTSLLVMTGWFRITETATQRSSIIEKLAETNIQTCF